MKARWVLLAIVGGMCALLRAEVQLEQRAPEYTQGDHWDFYWYQPQSGPREPVITIYHGIDAVAFHFRCWDDVTGDPADIRSITGDSASSMLVHVKVVAADGVSPGAANVGWVDFPGNMQCWIRGFHITGTLGTLGLESHIRGTYEGPFTVADVGDPLTVYYGVWSDFSMTGPGSHQGDLSIGELRYATLTITGDYEGYAWLGTMTGSALTINGNLGAAGELVVPYFADPAENPPTITVTGNAPGTIQVGSG